MTKKKNSVSRIFVYVGVAYVLGIYSGIMGDAFRLFVYRIQIQNMNREMEEIYQKNVKLNDRWFDCQIENDKYTTKHAVN